MHPQNASDFSSQKLPSSTGAQKWVLVILGWIKYFLHNPREPQCVARNEWTVDGHGEAESCRICMRMAPNAESVSADALDWTGVHWALVTFSSCRGCSVGQQWRQQSGEKQTSHCHKEGSSLEWNHQGCISDLHKTRDFSRVIFISENWWLWSPQTDFRATCGRGCPAIKMRLLAGRENCLKTHELSWKSWQEYEIRIRWMDRKNVWVLAASVVKIPTKTSPNPPLPQKREMKARNCLKILGWNRKWSCRGGDDSCPTTASKVHLQHKHQQKNPRDISWEPTVKENLKEKREHEFLKENKGKIYSSFGADCTEDKSSVQHLQWGCLGCKCCSQDLCSAWAEMWQSQPWFAVSLFGLCGWGRKSLQRTAVQRKIVHWLRN